MIRKKRKSKFQQRLEEMQKKHTEFREDPGPGNVNPHDENPGGPRDLEPQTTTNHNWYCTKVLPPPYYSNVDLWVGNEIMKEWHRVSDGDKDYYCNSKDNSILTNPTHWKKRPGVNYPEYEPLTEDDIKQVTYRELIEVRDLLEKESLPTVEVQYHEGFNDGLTKAIKAINNLIRTKRMT